MCVVIVSDVLDAFFFCGAWQEGKCDDDDDDDNNVDVVSVSDISNESVSDISSSDSDCEISYADASECKSDTGDQW
jgi:nucleosome binding factor SPN SPT16 subunit